MKYLMEDKMSITIIHGQIPHNLVLGLWLKSLTKLMLVMLPFVMAMGSAFADNPAWYVGKYYNPTNPASPTGFTTGYKLYRTIGCPGKELLGIPCIVPPPPEEISKVTPATVSMPETVKQPEAGPAATEVQKESGIVKILASSSIYFDFDKSIIKPEYRETLKKNYEVLKSLPITTVLRLEGNCDERGSVEYNIALGQRRADAVRRAIVLLGFQDAKIQTISWGKEKPRCLEHSEQCWNQNRRVDFIAQ
jgi:peptidoglycan-associated lipoprotein